MTGPCLSAQTLRAFLDDQLVEPELSAAEVHLSQCERCQAAADGLGSDVIEQLRSLREAMAETASEESPPNGLLNRAIQVQHRADEPSDSDHWGYLVPGVQIAGRFRIRTLLGKGSVGEVYLADDLSLNKQVALKRIPERFHADPVFRASLLNEVRLSHRITHANVCRIHDFQETVDQLFLIMEYIEGESLAALLRRIKRLPFETALLVGRELCLGLSAAHAQGVIHRDLKPANIMLDHRGHVRITDLGLAQADGDRFQPAQGFAGTPAYAAPEQVLKNQTSVQSDLFSLGMVLHEIFLGRRPTDLVQLQPIREWHASGTPMDLSELHRRLDPSVSGMIERCLSPDPRDRPDSADEVREAFAGADPFEVARREGRALTPDDLVEEGERRRLSGRQAAACGGAILLLLAVFSLLSQWMPRTELHAEQSPAVLARQARQVLQEIGHAALPTDNPSPDPPDRAYGFSVHHDVRGPVYFWYRQSPDRLVPRYFVTDPSRPMMLSRGAVNWDDPPIDSPGMVLVWLTSQGGLRGLRAVSTTEPDPQPTAPDPAHWQTVLSRLTQMDLTAFQRQTCVSTAPLATDAAWEWIAPSASSLDPATRVEAAFLKGKLLYVRVDDPDRSLGSGLEWQGDAPNRRLGGLSVLFTVGLIVWSGFACWSHATTGRLDYPTVWRLAVLMLLISLAAWMLQAKHVLAIEEAAILQSGLARSVLMTSMICLWYAAIEYSLRKYSPRTMIGWTTVLRGRVFEPGVGRDVVAGVIGGVAIAGISTLGTIIALQLPGWPLDRMPSALNYLLGIRHYSAALLDATERSIQMALGAALLLLVCRRLVPERASLFLFGGLLVVLFAQMRGGSLLAWTSAGLVATVAAVVIGRYGVLATMVMTFVRSLLLYPQPTEGSEWYAEGSRLTMVIVLGLAVLGLVTASSPARWLPLPRGSPGLPLRAR